MPLLSATLDDFDHALLAQLRHDNQVPARVLAERVGLSESAVLRRLRRLRRDRVIVADVSRIDAGVLGTPLTVHVLVSLERESAGLVDAFARTLRNRPEVRDAWYVTGDADFVVRLALADMETYEAFTRAVFLDDPNVKAFRTLVAMRQVAGVPGV